MSVTDRSAGRTRWFIPDAYIPPKTTNDQPSHESICLLNVADTDARVTFGAYFEDGEPQFSMPIEIPARRAFHLRTDDPARVGGLKISVGIPYALTVSSDVCVLVQYSRLDTTQSAYSLMSVIPAGEK
jgi:hypothetical protein